MFFMSLSISFRNFNLDFFFSAVILLNFYLRLPPIDDNGIIITGKERGVVCDLRKIAVAAN